MGVTAARLDIDARQGCIGVLHRGERAGSHSIERLTVALHRREPEGSARNVWTGTVTDLDRRADRVRVRVTGTVPLVAEITPAALIALDLAVGQTVWISVKATEIIGYPA